MHGSLAFKSAFSYRKKVDIWRSYAPKLKFGQLYACFFQILHVYASGIIAIHLLSEELKKLSDIELFKCLFFVSLHGKNMGGMYDLIWIYSIISLEFFNDKMLLQALLLGIIRQEHKCNKSSTRSSQFSKAQHGSCSGVLPDATLSLQQQIVGPEPLFAWEYALQVLGSAKAVAWYCPTRQEVLAELRFHET
ncbi:hypothetical protein VNO77_23518 [Canavalia gladiata]|uniref:Uncharacterized protein n=1 Tax=Canavalia gladiata TaxID=3824 RepID=A0AAN9QBS2_CANGL